MEENDGYTPRRTTAREKAPSLVTEIQQRLGELGIKEYTHLPRKHKKAAKKLALGQHLTQRELARLDALNRQSKED